MGRMVFESTSVRVLRRIFLTLLLLAALGVVGMNILRSGRTGHIAKLARAEGRLESLILRASRDNARLESELGRLETGALGWQDAARREHGMLLPGEVVFRFPSE